jgi:rhodanese-related sulfurtransferase
MVEEWQTENQGNSLKTIAVIIIIIISIIAVSALTLTANWEEQVYPERKYTTSYTPVTPLEAKELINNTINLVIADIRGCDCDYNKGHLEYAIWQTYAPNFYNTVHDLLIYDKNGTNSIKYCKNLINHVYGEIYYLEGGIEAWEEAGFKTIAVQKD